ncbi:hypothetical protein HKX48_001723 [Thoreauomyces humboldtii]|nr:hypothetical protein HKX48_001723 [Thoreauomyces humboldtii]
MVAVGYMDPGNWSTDLSGGSQFHYTLLFAVLFSSLVAMLLQSLACKLGLVTGQDLAQCCRAKFHPYVNLLLYATAEIAICATDLAEVIGSAIAMELLFGLPLAWGVVLTGADVFIVLLGFGSKHLRWFEYFVMGLVGTIGVCFVTLLVKVKPVWGDVFAGFVPHGELFSNSDQLYIFMGIVGATVMPHNLYLGTHLVQYRYNVLSLPTLEPAGTIHDLPDESRARDARISRHHIKLLPKTLKFTLVDCLLSLTFALFINSAILIVSGAAFFSSGNRDIASINDAYYLLETLLSPVFAVVFGVALLASAQSSTITGTLAGQIVMAGFLGSRFRMPPWARRLVSRAVAIIPALIVVLVVGSAGLNKLLVLSQESYDVAELRS